MMMMTMIIVINDFKNVLFFHPLKSNSRICCIYYSRIGCIHPRIGCIHYPRIDCIHYSRISCIHYSKIDCIHNSFSLTGSVKWFDLASITHANNLAEPIFHRVSFELSFPFRRLVVKSRLKSPFCPIIYYTDF